MDTTWVFTPSLKHNKQKLINNYVQYNTVFNSYHRLKIIISTNTNQGHIRIQHIVKSKALLTTPCYLTYTYTPYRDQQPLSDSHDSAKTRYLFIC